MWDYEVGKNTKIECIFCHNRNSSCNTDEGCNSWNTFDAWSSFGHKILKGQKATKINGVNKFHISQVGSSYHSKECYTDDYTTLEENMSCPINI